MWLRLLYVFLAGIILPFAFAPASVYALAFIAPAVLLYQWQKATPAQAFTQGGVFGLGFFGIGVSWVYISIHTYGNASTFVASLITAAFIIVLALFLATQGYVLVRLFGKKKPLGFCLAAFPVTWVIWEWLRSLPFNGFAWLYLGYTQLTTPLRGLAPLLGVFGVSLAVAMIAGIAVVLSTKQTPMTKVRALIVLALILLIGWGFSDKKWTRPQGTPITVALIQANISQSLKWEPGEFNHIVQTYQTLTEPYWEKSRLIVWPEAALPAFPAQIPQLLDQLQQTTAQHHASLLLGMLLGNPDEKRYFNGMMLLGNNTGEYRKRHLVPFGEYTPLQSVFAFIINYWQIPMSDFTAGADQQPDLKIDETRIAPFICYEIAYPLQVLRYSKNSGLLVNISDDSWFGHSMAAAQQAEMAQMRALETGRFAVLSANTGVTGIINPLGKFTALLPPYQQGVLSGEVTPMQGKTPLMKWDYFPLAIILVLLLFL